ncbi:MAG TPA: HAD-IC family P-type ATPase [Synergistales bacterium]|jgi:Ca2+-transporting ATPase|nr:HAD-IC family P-type ATPase [Synergistales bacterium]MDI9392069.1 HAD-IC family P-type ATPase [Synergistota bacterium]MDD3829613.1 HAD-IC family P-type ATPase [Synergistales bacterium]MDD4023081.1 HAD-IC family P-type ATPase [Synergistales bacterium]MDD5515013.1 HAD-IC family P-type ATPase [Synergistales bacterium]
MDLTKAHALDAKEILAALDVDPEKGLDDLRVEELIERYGPNQINPEEPEPWWKSLLRQFMTPMIYLLTGASLISLVMKETLDAFAILVVILINGGIGFVTEFRAEKALMALKAMISPTAVALRGGVIRTVSAASLVPGDIILLEAGDVVPADARVFEQYNLGVDEAALTGESLPVDKTGEILPVGTELADRKNCLFSGTAVVRGSGRAVVFGTGMGTEIGRISSMLSTVSKSATPLEERLARLSGLLIRMVIGIAILVTGLGVLQGRGIVRMIETGIALAVAAVPEGLPFVATMTLAIGVHRMAKRNALVRNLASVETLGSTTVICTDKTGTLTMNDMAVRSMVPAHPECEDLLLRVSVLCNKAHLEEDSQVGDPMEVALLRSALSRGIDIGATRRATPIIGEEPFDSQTMRMITWHRDGVAAKGAPERILQMCRKVWSKNGLVTFSEEYRREWMERIEAMAAQGMRTLAFAWGDDEGDLSFLGVAGIFDPPRPEVRDSVRSCIDAGIHVIMVTGDHLVTARSIAAEVGILGQGGSKALSGSELAEMEEGAIASQAREIAVVARVAPEHKLRIVRSLQASGEVVAMTGDGVNDAVALKQADVGIAMGIQGTEVSKEASDIILQDDRFSTIVTAIGEGRKIFDNIRKSVLFLLCCNLSEVITVLGGIALGLPSILLPLQILWINLVTDVAPALALALDPAEPDVMSRPPKKRQEDILTRWHMANIVFYGLVISLGVFAAYAFSVRLHPGDPARATEICFHTLVFAQLFFVFNVRNRSLLGDPGQIFANPWLLAGVGFSALLQFNISHVPIMQEVLDIVPLSVTEWGIVIASALLPTLVAQARKVLRNGMVG